MMRTPIADMLDRMRNGTRFCMPGHKGKSGFPGVFAHEYDITELPGADNLYMPAGVIRESQKLHADFIGAAACFFLVNGSSGGIHAALLSILKPGEKILMARDMHLSAVSALALAGAQPVFMPPSTGHPELPGVLVPADVAAAIQKHPDAKAVYLTYPNYYGLCADLNEICAVAHRADMMVICDAAHAAAFDFSDLMPVSPAAAGCDMWISSLHKTLPAMNQCAVLCIGDRAGIDANTVQSRLNLLQTTSPSYVLLASAEYALAYMREKGKKAMGSAVALAEDAIRRIEALGGYRCVTKDIPPACRAFDRDILRLVIDVTDRGVSGFTAARRLAKEGVYAESADASHMILLCTVADVRQDFDHLCSVLAGLKGAAYQIKRTEPDAGLEEIMQIPLRMTPRKAAFAARRSVPLIDSEGCVSTVCAGLYPPGIPIILPGQEITRGMVEYLARMRQSGYAVFGTDGTIEVADI